MENISPISLASPTLAPPSAAAAPPNNPLPPELSDAFGPPQPLDWLIPDRIPLGRITLFLGPPESGKSSIAIDLANRLATGQPWPNAQPLPPDPDHVDFSPDTPENLRQDRTYRDLIRSLNAKVAAMNPTPAPQIPPAAPVSSLILTPFQNPSLAITPLLHQFNPNPTKVFYCSDESFNSPLPSANLPNRLRAALANHPEIKLIIIDPILSILFLMPKTQIPLLLGELSALALATGVAIVATAPAPATTRSTPNSPLAQLCSHATAIYQLSFDPREPGHRTMQTVKFPGHLPPPALTAELSDGQTRYLVAQYTLPIAPAARPGLRDDDPTPNQIDFAVEFLRETLTLKPMTVQKILEHARTRRIAPRTLYRAKGLLAVRSYRLTSPIFGPFWAWSTSGQPDISDFPLEF